MAFLNYVYNIIVWIITSHGSLYLYLYGLFWSNKILYIISDNDESPRHLDYLPACCKSHRDKCMFKIQPSSHPKQPYPFELNSTSCKLLAITVLCSFCTMKSRDIWAVEVKDARREFANVLVWWSPANQTYSKCYDHDDSHDIQPVMPNEV